MDSASTNGVLYFERQKLNLKWLWLIYLLLGIPLLAMVGYSSYWYFADTGTFSGMPDTKMVLLILNGGIVFILLLIPIFINSLVMKTLVSSGSIKIKLGPWLRRSVELREVVRAEVVRISSAEQASEYGERVPGWRLKSHNTFYIGGDQEAVELQLKDGTKVIIGSQQPVELQKALQ